MSRVRWAGVGIDLRAQRAEPAAVRQAVRGVLDVRARFRRAAARPAHAIDGTDAVRSVLEIAIAIALTSDREPRTPALRP